MLRHIHGSIIIYSLIDALYYWNLIGDVRENHSICERTGSPIANTRCHEPRPRKNRSLKQTPKLKFIVNANIKIDIDTPRAFKWNSNWRTFLYDNDGNIVFFYALRATVEPIFRPSIGFRRADSCHTVLLKFLDRYTRTIFTLNRKEVITISTWDMTYLTQKKRK